MQLCCIKLVDGNTCPTTATRRITLGARGMVFKVPICETHFKMLPAATGTSTDDLLRDMFGPTGARRKG